MRAAADLEDKNEKHIVTPARIVPARELLGEISGSALAAERSGDRVKAAYYYKKLAALAKNADTARPELTVARKYAQL